MFKRFRNNKGLSTIELLATVFVFSIIVVIVGGIVARSIHIQRRAAAAQKVQENALFILESMAKEIRVSEVRNQNSDCTATSLNITHPINGEVSYMLSGGTVRRIQGSATNIVSSSDIEFTRLLFCIRGSGLSDNLPSRVTIVASLKNKTGNEVVSADLQTTITSRVITN